MKKIFLVSVLCVFTMSLAIAQQEKKSSQDMFSYIPYKSATWKQKTTIENDAGVSSIQQMVWFKNKKMRTEGSYLDKATNKEGEQIIIVTNKYMYIIIPEQKQGIKYSMDSPNNPEKQRQSLDKFRKNAQKVGSEAINGVDCDIYQYSFNTQKDSNTINAEVKEWRTVKDAFPIKTESFMKITGEKTVTMKTTTEITDLQTDIDIPDSKFVPDSNIKMMDMDKMTNGNNEGQEGQSK